MNRADLARQISSSLIALSKSSEALDINELRIILGLERIVARLAAHSKLSSHLIFKGGFVLLKAYNSERFTRDLDALGVDIDRENVEALVPDALLADLSDGFWFGDIRTFSLDEQGEYGALRFDCAFQIGDPPSKETGIKKLSRLHFDIGFGDQIPKDLKQNRMPTLLKDNGDISWQIYPSEYIYSEKLQTLVSRGSLNSRAKDIHDLIFLFPLCGTARLKKAVSQTFATRQTKIPSSFSGFANTLTTTMLENAWQSVRLSTEETTFAQAWNDLKAQFVKLDQLMNV